MQTNIANRKHYPRIGAPAADFGVENLIILLTEATNLTAGPHIIRYLFVRGREWATEFCKYLFSLCLSCVTGFSLSAVFSTVLVCASSA